MNTIFHPSASSPRTAFPSPHRRPLPRLGVLGLFVPPRRIVFPLPGNDAGRWIRRRGALEAVPVSADAAAAEELGLRESELRNPVVSTSYRPAWIAPPNQTVLDAQARVCTGPTQTRPLSEEQAFKVLGTILRSARGELKDAEVSKSQLGAFFAAMTIRANAFPEATQWSEGEARAMKEFWPQLVQVLPPDVIFIADPEGTIMGGSSSIGPQFVGQGTAEMRLVGALREVLAGGHLGYEEVQGVLRDILPLELEGGKSKQVSESLLSAFLIGQRMNRETDRELKAYCLAFDDELGSRPVADVKSLTHYGEPYDGNTRFFRSTLFVAAVRACYGESCLLHGADWMPPKGGVTEEQMLKFMGANTHLSLMEAKTLLEDEKVGLAYVSQRDVSPSQYSLLGLREHIKKRPPFASAEKVQQFVRVRYSYPPVYQFCRFLKLAAMLCKIRLLTNSDDSIYILCLLVNACCAMFEFSPRDHLKCCQVLRPLASRFCKDTPSVTWLMFCTMHLPTLMPFMLVAFLCMGGRWVRGQKMIHMLLLFVLIPGLPQATGREAVVAGFYHEGYEDALLMLMKRRSVHSGLVVKGEEGALSMTTKARSGSASKGLPVNYCSGFRSPSAESVADVDGISRQSFNLVVDAKDYGFESTDTPRTDRSVLRNIELGLAALNGERGPAYDRIVLNAGMVDHLLGCPGAEDVTAALDRAREAIDSGTALNRLMNYIKFSHNLK